VIAVAPPPSPGQWQQLGAAAVSRPGKSLHVLRTALDPQSVAIVVTSKSKGKIRIFWSNVCEGSDMDGMQAQQQGRASGVGRVVVYPPVAMGSSRCYVTVTASPLAGATVTAAEFFY
jgi:hypothetical protein